MGLNHVKEKRKQERLGETKLNTQGLEMTIIEYNDSSDITVKFSIDNYTRKARYTEFKAGSVSNHNFPKPKSMPLKEKRMSEVVVNKEGYKMHLYAYYKQKDVIVEFEDEYKAHVHTDYRFFKSGGVKNPNRIGPYGERLGNESPTHKDGKELKIFGVWRGILYRTNGSTEHSRRFYNDVTMTQEWLYYTNFYNWVISQDNYQKWEDNIGGVWQIDKDILSDPFNKIYSAETCCLVPDYINSLVVRQRQKNRKSKLPLGIQYYPYKGGKYFYVNKRDGKSRVNVYFNTIEEAIKGYKEYKYKCLKETADYAYQMGDITQKCYKGLLKYDLFAYEDLSQYNIGE